ncbi:hypothetical protein WICPIJ_010126 [Wickerhamomyces pijperi]|uniref:Uncharacterized protein n=1 Tax=Wickerhamomyces pijperi TaxID=599730 RepID=A0A9P8PIX4_WICPI|nr:hypothetical protein WICPIJ_010126 [Wickerhamomyces pijperi]
MLNSDRKAYALFIREGSKIPIHVKNLMTQSPKEYRINHTVRIPETLEFENPTKEDAVLMPRMMAPLIASLRARVYKSLTLIFVFDTKDYSVYKDMEFYTMIWDLLKGVPHSIEIIKRNVDFTRLTKSEDLMMGLFQFNQNGSFSFDNESQLLTFDLQEPIIETDEINWDKKRVQSTKFCRNLPLFNNLREEVRNEILDVKNSDLLGISVTVVPSTVKPRAAKVSSPGTGLNLMNFEETETTLKGSLGVLDRGSEVKMIQKFMMHNFKPLVRFYSSTIVDLEDDKDVDSRATISTSLMQQLSADEYREGLGELLFQLSHRILTHGFEFDLDLKTLKQGNTVSPSRGLFQLSHRILTHGFEFDLDRDPESLVHEGIHETETNIQKSSVLYKRSKDAETGKYRVSKQRYGGTYKLKQKIKVVLDKAKSSLKDKDCKVAVRINILHDHSDNTTGNSLDLIKSQSTMLIANMIRPLLTEQKSKKLIDGLAHTNYFSSIDGMRGL